MSSRLGGAALVASPSYPNSVAWSDENLIAVASGHLVTILNPAMPVAPRGFITVPAKKLFPIGVIERKDLLSDCLLPTSLSRDFRPCVRSISWSPIGFAPNSGCLLAVCTAEGCAKLYCSPFSEFSAEWLEVMDISDILYDYLANINFMEPDILTSEISDDQGTQNLEHSVLRKEHKRNGRDVMGSTASKEVATFPSSFLREDSSVEVFKMYGSQRVWFTGVLERFNGARALVRFQETGETAQHDEWVEMNESDEISGTVLPSDTVDEQANHFPKIRPSMNVGNLPDQKLWANCNGVGEILKIGQAVEAWTNYRWQEGKFVGFSKGGLQVKLSGDIAFVTLDASSVRLAPLWDGEHKSWQLTIVKIEMDHPKLPTVVDLESDRPREDNRHEIVCVTKSKRKTLKKIPEEHNLSLVAANKYTSRSAMLSLLVVSWSPVLFLSSGNGNSSNCYSLLAVGGKSGQISLWKICEPECYTIDNASFSSKSMLVGLFRAHDAWITTISWALLASDTSVPQILLATGCSDGRVKIWLGCSDGLLSSAEVNLAPFALLKEGILVDCVPVSVLSLIVPAQFPHKVLLAIGRGSGSFEVWIYDIKSSTFHKVDPNNVHDHVVTGLAWAFDGRYLYSCSQDNCLRCWLLNGSSLSEVPFPSAAPCLKSSTDIPNVSDSCFGVAVSPGNLVLAVARSFDAELLNPMYQARKKAAVEFYWTGGQQLDISLDRQLDTDIQSIPGFSEKELSYWESNILWSLNQFECPNKCLVVWDIILALSAFKQSNSTYVEQILSKWLLGSHMGFYTKENLSKISSRKLHLLNILCRRVVLSELKSDNVICEKEEKWTLWRELLLSSEEELRIRLVGFSFTAVNRLNYDSVEKSDRHGYFDSMGLAQMERWVALNNGAEDQLKLLASEVRKLDMRVDNEEEQCSYCSASVPFESPEVAFCKAVQSHKLSRCAVSMTICPTTTPLWFCICCERWVSKLAPKTLFKLHGYPSDSKSATESSTLEVSRKALCPFCGILLQRLQPDFLLSASPV